VCAQGESGTIEPYLDHGLVSSRVRAVAVSPAVCLAGHAARDSMGVAFSRHLALSPADWMLELKHVQLWLLG